MQKIGRFAIKEKIGEGGMGKVYKAYDSRTNRTVAIKTIDPELISQKHKKRFLREAQIMAKLAHPNIVSFYHMQTDAIAGQDFIVMDFVEGKALHRCNFTIRQSLIVIQKISLAIDYAHNQGIIHRDLKPANIMVNKENMPLVMDFGLAKSSMGKSLTQKGEIFGTPRYMSPEQAQGAKASKTMDIYSLGAILYELLAGVPAIQGHDPTQIIFHAIHGKVLPLQKHNPNLASELQIICAKAMAKEPSMRYQRAKDLAEDIDRFLYGKIIKAKKFPWQHYLKKYKVTILALPIPIILLLGYFLWQQQKQINFHLRNAQKILKQVPGNWATIDSLEKANSSAYKENIAKIIPYYIQAIDPLNKALQLAPKNKYLLQQLANLYSSIGFLALAHKEYLLSFRAFGQCRKFDSQKAKKLLALWKQEKEKEREKQLKIIYKIMKLVQAKQPGEKELDWWMGKLLHMGNPLVVKELLSYIKSRDKQQRLLAIRTLGRLRDAHTKFKQKDSVLWLLQHLKELSSKMHISEFLQEAEEIVWALGWLQDARANAIVNKIRHQTGRDSLFWNRTSIPYKWIPTMNKKAIDAKDFIAMGTINRDKGRFTDAIKNFTKAIKLSPLNPDTYNFRGLSWLEKGQLEKALWDFNKAIAINPRYTAAYSSRAMVWMVKKQLKKAILDLNKAIEFSPKLSTLYNNRGLIFRKQGKLKKAILDFDKAIVYAPENTKYLLNRGNTRLVNQELKKALVDFNKAMELNPRLIEVYHCRGAIFQKQGKLERALLDYSKAIDLNPRNYLSYLKRGSIWDTKGYLAKALADCEQAIKLSPKLSKCHYSRGLILVKMKEFYKAIAAFSKAIGINPQNAILYIDRGNTLGKLGEYDKALADFNTVINLAPKNFYAYSNSGKIYIKKKQFNKAILSFNQAIKINPKFTYAYFQRGLVLYNLGKFRKALVDFNRVIKTEPDLYKVAYMQRGDIWYKWRRYDKALADLNKAIELDAKFGEAYGRRSQIKKNMGRLKEAIIDLHKAEQLLPKNYIMQYNLACYYSLQKNKNKAFYHLQKALELGFSHKNHLRKDPDLRFIRQFPTFLQILK